MVSDDASPARPAAASWLVRTTAPLHFALAFAAGALLQTGLDLPLPTGDARTAMHLTGTVFANAGGLLALACFALFVWRRTTILPSQTPSRLIVRGPYRLSRNPFYLSLLLTYTGLAAILDVPWALLTLPAPLLALQRVVIPFEEAQLRAQFGGDYAAYCRAVGRWW